MEELKMGDMNYIQEVLKDMEFDEAITQKILARAEMLLMQLFATNCPTTTFELIKRTMHSLDGEIPSWAAHAIMQYADDLPMKKLNKMLEQAHEILDVKSDSVIDQMEYGEKHHYTDTSKGYIIYKGSEQLYLNSSLTHGHFQASPFHHRLAMFRRQTDEGEKYYITDDERIGYEISELPERPLERLIFNRLCELVEEEHAKIADKYVEPKPTPEITINYERLEKVAKRYATHGRFNIDIRILEQMKSHGITSETKISLIATPDEVENQYALAGFEEHEKEEALELSKRFKASGTADVFNEILNENVPWYDRKIYLTEESILANPNLTFGDLIAERNKHLGFDSVRATLRSSSNEPPIPPLTSPKIKL